ncbi:MAG: hypothetical protein JXQ30_01535 [Spirochaetes bacterium]|nr:hypothetical protein [Spirochaetota bacterium]
MPIREEAVCAPTQNKREPGYRNHPTMFMAPVIVLMNQLSILQEGRRANRPRSNKPHTAFLPLSTTQSDYIINQE